MRIGIDARTILNPEQGEAIGAGHYTYQLIRHLLQADQENHYVLFFDFRVREKDIKKFTRPNVTIRFYPFSDYKKYLPGAYNELLGRATLAREKLDVLHATSASSRIPASYAGKTVVTFHDMGMYREPKCYPAVRRLRDRAVFSLMAGKADKIIAVSQSIRDDVKKYLEVSDEGITVVRSGLDRRFFETPPAESQKVLSRMGIEKKYILFLGTLEPTKNITRILEAFRMLKDGYAERGESFGYQLVLAGKRGWLSQEYPQIVKDFGLTKDVVFPGYVVGDELVPLFRGAEFFVLPSLYEGFGTTLLEAFATETPAIVSRVSSLPEIAGNAAHFVNPVDVTDIADAMKKFITDPNLRDSYKRKGLEQARKFDWEACARETLAVYKNVVEK